MNIEFGAELRREAGRCARMLDDILPGLKEVSEASNDNKSSYGEHNLSLMVDEMCNQLDRRMLHGDAVYVRDTLQQIASNDLEFSLSPYATLKKLTLLREKASGLAEAGYYPAELGEIRDFLQESEELSDYMKQAQRAKRRYQQSDRKPCKLSFSPHVKQQAATLSTKLSALHDVEIEKQISARSVSHDEIIFKRDLHYARYILGVIGQEDGAFESGQDAAKDLKVLLLCSQSLTKHGHAELQQLLATHEKEFEAAMIEAEKAARKELRGKGGLPRH